MQHLADVPSARLRIVWRGDDDHHDDQPDAVHDDLVDLDVAPADIRDQLDHDRAQSWREVLTDQVAARLDAAPVDLRARVIDLLGGRM